MNELNNLVFVNGKPFHPSALEHSSLLDSFVSYEENEELWIWHLMYKSGVLYIVC